MYLIFNAQGRLNGTADSLPDQEDLTANGQTAVEAETFDPSATYLFSDGQVRVIPAAPSPYHELVDGAWVLPETAKNRQLADAKSSKLAEINRAAQAFINQAAELDKVPEFEVATWPLQAAEAQAWHTNPEAETPVLAAIAAARGLDLEKLRAAALRKANAYTALSAHIAGQRQALADKLSKAKTLKAIEAVSVSYVLPG